MTFRDTVTRAADKAALSPKKAVAVNAYLILAHTMAETGNLTLPYGGLAAVSEVLRERAGHSPSNGSLRWYKNMLLKDPQMVGKIVELPAAFKTLVSPAA